MGIRYIINVFKLRIANFGNVPLCNGKPSRGIFIGDFCLPICARCFSMVVFSFLFYFLTLKGKIKRMSNISCILFILPLVIDGTLQYVFNIESTNFRRILTGMFFGLGYGNFLANILLTKQERELNSKSEAENL